MFVTTPELIKIKILKEREEVGARHFLFLPIFLFLLPITLLDLKVEQSAQETAKN